ncbi:hypothetical protein OJAV_G00084790 [Oryzias javanicus]|uniref:Uncharacterized protein n=1 Tax=Oryzias javanicus TaxID=123683 RepID=A0A437CYL4_ORYJA|nr:hypothetical protein OJAV_G00084790 [Oryzias javanicus]
MEPPPLSCSEAFLGALTPPPSGENSVPASAPQLRRLGLPPSLLSRCRPLHAAPPRLGFPQSQAPPEPPGFALRRSGPRGTMDGASQLSGETLVVHHIPLVHCQVSGGRRGGCGGSLRTGSPFSPPENLGLSRTTSLPERDVLQREALLYSSLIQTSSTSWSSHSGGGAETKRGGSTGSDHSSFTSSTSEEQLPRAKARSRNPLRHNPFLLHAEDEEEEEEEEGGEGATA